MRLAQFIDAAVESIIAQSLAYAAEIPALRDADSKMLRDHLPRVLDTIARDLEQPQTRSESITKSQGRAHAPIAPTAAQTHGELRARSGLDIEQLVAEYRVLRSSVLRLWLESQAPDIDALQDVLRFNEAIDQAIAESVAFHHAEVEKWRHIFLGVLSHDLRNPLNGILLTAELVARGIGEPAEHAGTLNRNGRRMTSLLDALLEYNKSTLGTGMAIQREAADLSVECQEEVDMLQQAFRDKPIDFEVSGDTKGLFDSSRIREALANLVSNAAQHSPENSRVTVTLRGSAEAVEISTENLAEPIPADVLDTLFEPLRRHQTTNNPSVANMGLGLFIVREIARAHRGDVSVEAAEGRIRFTFVLPRQPALPILARASRRHRNA